jgi:hypothetical protein
LTVFDPNIILCAQKAKKKTMIHEIILQRGQGQAREIQRRSES